MPEQYTELQLDALREVSNTGSGHAAGDLSEMFGHSFDISVPRALVTRLADGIELLGGAETEVQAVAVHVGGEVDAVLVATFTPAQATNLCGMLGIEHDSEMGQSVLQEVGNVVACAYANVLSEMSGMTWEVDPPAVTFDMLGSVVGSVIAASNADIDSVLLIDSQLCVNDVDVQLSLLFLPFDDAIENLLERMGVA